MKKGLFYLGLIILLIPGALANISIYGPDYSDYNIGNKISVTISISSEENIPGFLKAILKCGDTQLNYFTTPIELANNKEERINIPPIVTTKTLTGDCVVEASLYSPDDVLIENSFSESFRITDSLELTIQLDKTNIKPDDKLRISGTVKTIRNENIKNGNVKIIISDFDGDFSTLLNNGNFDYTINFVNNIKSGPHLITVIVEDNLDNSDHAELEFNVEGIPTELKNSINKLSFKPEETMEIETLLFDQVNDLIITNVAIKIIDPSGKKVLEREISTDSVLRFNFPKYALPGKWLIRSEAEGLRIESKVNIEIVEKIKFLIEDPNLIISNVGNVVYKKPINIIIGDKTITKKTSLRPGETVNIILSKEIKESGSYDIKIIFGDEEEIFENISLQRERKSFGDFITGNFVLGTAGKAPSFVYYIILGVILVGFLFVSYFNFKGKQKKIDKFEGKQKAKKWTDKIRAKKEEEKNEKSFKLPYDREEAVKQFKERVKFEAETKKEKTKQAFDKKNYFEIKPKKQTEPEKKPFSFMVDKGREETPIRPSEPFEEPFEKPFEREVIDLKLDDKKEEPKKEALKRDDKVDEGNLFKMFD